MELFTPAVTSMLLRRWSIKGSAIDCCYCLLRRVGQGDDEGVMVRRRDGSVRSREESTGRTSFLLLLPAIALLLCCRGDDEGMMARRRDGSMRSREEESAGRSSFLLLLPAIARCGVLVEATMRA